MRRRTFLTSLGAAPAIALIEHRAVAAESPASSTAVPDGIALSGVSGVTGEISTIRYRTPATADAVALLAEGVQPADVDLVGMAGRAMNYLTRNPRPALDFEPVPALAYVQFPAACVGEELTVRYPLAEFNQTVDFRFVERPDLRFELGWAGNSVISIKPQAAQLPLPTVSSA